MDRSAQRKVASPKPSKKDQKTTQHSYRASYLVLGTAMAVVLCWAVTTKSSSTTIPNGLGNTMDDDGLTQQPIPIDQLTDEELTKQIQDEQQALVEGKRYMLTPQPSHKQFKISYDYIIQVNHQDQYIVFKRVASLKRKIDAWFARNGHNLFDGHTKEALYAQIAPYHRKVLAYMTLDSPYYQKTQQLFGGQPDASQPSHPLATATFSFAHDMTDTVTQVCNEKQDPHLNVLHGKVYRHTTDLQVTDQKYLVDATFREKLIQESRQHGLLPSHIQIFEQGMQGWPSQKNPTAKALYQAYQQGYLTEDHILSLYLYTFATRLSFVFVSAETHGRDRVQNLRDTIYFYAVYQDLLARIAYIRAHPALGIQIPTLPIWQGRPQAQHPIKLYRGITHPLLCKDFQGRSPSAVSTTSSLQQASYYGRFCILTVAPSCPENALDVGWLGTYLGSEILITGGQLCIHALRVGLRKVSS